MKTLLVTLLAIALLGFSALGVSGILPGGDGVVSRKTLSDGTKLLVTQQYSGELGYEVGFYFKLPNEAWGWCYLDHEDTEWRNGRIEYDSGTDTVLVWKGSTLRGRWIRRAGKWERPDVAGWISSAPGDLRSPPFESNKD